MTVTSRVKERTTHQQSSGQIFLLHLVNTVFKTVIQMTKAWSGEGTFQTRTVEKKVESALKNRELFTAQVQKKDAQTNEKLVLVCSPKIFQITLHRASKVDKAVELSK
jgi:hypothetical protein